MRVRRYPGMLALAAMLVGCGSGGSSGGTTVVTPTPSPVPTPSPTPTTTASGGCALRARQDWLTAQMNEWYLFPDTLPSSPNPAGYATLEDYLDSLTAVARAQRKDRYFSYVTSVAEENAYYSSGATAGLGVRLAFDSTNHLRVTEAFEGAPALAAGIDRGTDILAVGSSVATLKTVTSMIAQQQYGVLDQAFGDSTPGTRVVLRIATAGGTRDVTLSKAQYEIEPVSTRYGYRVIDDGGRKVGYVNLRTFIATADDQLRTAFGAFKAQGVTNVIVDLRYNGGGALSTAETFTDLLGGGRSTADVQSHVTFRPSKSSENETINFAREAQAIAPARIAFIGTGDSASASEYVMNAFVPYLHGNAALIGTNTYGKPVGQIALDNPACPDDRLRVIAFALENAARQGDYFDGMASRMEATCVASDDLTHDMGDPAEASTAAALNFLAGRSCGRIGATASAARSTHASTPARQLLRATRPSAAQRETPGLY